jgi:single-strand DNA-binding protein
MEDGDMSQENTIILRGFVTAEPKFWQSPPSHTPLAEIRMGHTPRRLNRETGEWVDGQTSYYSVKCWRRLALNVKGSLRKGDMILVKGKVVMREWVDDQQRKHVQMQVEADSVGHDLAYGWSHFNRGDQSPWNSARRQAEAETEGPGDDAYPGELLKTEPDGFEDADDQDSADAADIARDPADPVIADADLQRLTSDLGAQADVAPVF